MKKQLLLFVMIWLPLVASADAVEINGIYYNLVFKTKTAEVTSNPNKYTGTVVIPESVAHDGNDYNVTSIGDDAFNDCKDLTSITIPNSIASIGNQSFKNCRGLNSITIPNSVSSIGYSAFWNCTGLTSISIPNSVTSIYKSVFRYCTGLTNISIPNSVTIIGETAFGNCTSLTSITIPNSVTDINNHAFENCNNLNKVIINDLAAWCGIIFNGDYSNPLSLAHHIYSDENTEITKLIIPNSVTDICKSAFNGCTGLTNVTLSNNVIRIGTGAFRGCTGLTNMTIPNSVTYIENYAFADCTSMTSINIGNGIKSIGLYAFSGCQELADVYCHAINVPSTNTSAFNNSYIEYATLHVPAESVNAYKATEPWKSFKSIVEIGDGKCVTPTISYTNGKLMFNCETEGAECQYTISNNDTKAGSGSVVQLAVTYNISVYATKSGYDNSETATATLCWIDKEPTTEGITDGVAQIPSKAVLIQSEGGILKVEGVDDGTQVTVYTPDGKQAGSAVCRNGAALVGTNIKPGNTAIVKIGEKSVKVIVK